MKNEMKTCLGYSYEINETQLRNPCITVIDIDKNIKEQDILDLITNQNHFMDEHDQLSLKITKPSRMGDTLHAIIECNGFPKDHFKRQSLYWFEEMQSL
ncbi:hypothetical protein HHI36_002131 [Cryptolaemus montrouzieri]|uniref:Uncharacterized protein n=1 Tax=Cryptolaemus montrouzieri TaxID=559131 RepID=A0ABD2P9Z5_9CUCU